MSYTIQVEGFPAFQAEAGEKLALAIEKAGIDISHRCGGNARCTTCRVKFLSEEPPFGEAEEACLVEDGVLGQFRLACQIRLDRDVQCEVLKRASVEGWDPGPELEP